LAQEDDRATLVNETVREFQGDPGYLLEVTGGRTVELW
jgi:hypothetical protein